MTTNMEQVVERLKASKADFENEGRSDGRQWAMEAASYEELQKVARLELVASNAAGESFAVQFDRALGTDGRWDWESSFWHDRFDDLPLDRYVDAFIEGARGVWEEISDKL